MTTNARNSQVKSSLVKLARGLRRSRHRSESGQFLIEGLQPVGMAIEAGWPIDALIYSPDLLRSPFGQALVERHQGLLAEVSASVLESIAMKDHPQGLVAIARKRPTSLDSVSVAPCGVGLVSPQDPGNVGAVLRTLEAVGASPLFVLDGGVDPYHPAAIRASMGASFLVPAVESSFSAFARWVQERRIHLIGTSARAGREFDAVVPEKPWILLFGTEQKGLATAQIDACDQVVSLPMRGRLGSLNLAVAAGVLLYYYST